VDRFGQLSESFDVPETGWTGPRFSAIDVGSNSVRLMIGAEVDGRLNLLAEHGRTTRLAAGLSDANQRLSLRSIITTLRSLGQLLIVAKLAGAPRPRLAATEALRKAKNAATLVQLTKRRLGLDLAILEPAHEAQLTFQAVRNHVHPKGPLAIADLGGGSLELAGGSADTVEWWRTAPLGCIQITERYFAHDPPGTSTWENARRAASTLLSQRLPSMPFMVGCGGAFTSTAALAQDCEVYSATNIRGYRLTTARVCEIGHRVSAMPISDRSQLPYISPSRAYLAPAGTAIIAALLDLTTGWCVVSDRGLAWGLLLETWRQLRDSQGETHHPVR
jgi:exopolyphosphatase/guanosine-5'-triphosphate,3'-diphosphate pyrophosphatase